MRKIILRASVGFAGMDGIDAVSFPDDVTDEELNEEAWQFAISNAESYGYYLRPEDSYEYDDGGEYGECYSDDIDGWWEDYNPEEHDMLKPGGGKWQWD